MIMRFVKQSGEEDYFTERTEMFKVYKLDSINSIWVQVKDIGDDILFVGLNTSFSISSRDFHGYKGSSIYYTDLWLTAFSIKREKWEKKLCSDIGVFNLGDESFESLPSFKCNPKFLWPPPIWIMLPSYYWQWAELYYCYYVIIGSFWWTINLFVIFWHSYYLCTIFKLNSFLPSF